MIPFVAASMPTADTPSAFLSGAIAAFLTQTVHDAELLILDYGGHYIADLLLDVPRIRYVRKAVRMKRTGCAL